MRSVSVGRLLRRGACAGAVGALVLAGLGSGAAFADDEPQTDQLWIQAPYDQSVTVAPAGGTAQYRTLTLGLSHDNDNFTVTDGRLTVDVSGLTGVAEVAWPDNCTPNGAGTVAVCDTGDVPTRYSAQVQLKVRAAAGAAVGAQGAIEYSAEATGGPDGTLTAPEGNAETPVTVRSGPDLGIGAPQDATGVAPGTELTVPFAVTNTGNETAHGFTVQMYATYGLDVVTRYPQCAYTEPDVGGTYMPMTHATCTFDTDIAPGATVELPAPLRLTVTDHALFDRFDYEIEPVGGITDLDSSDNSRAWSIDADNTADFAAHGTEVSGAAGDTVTAAFRFTNAGPAWVGNVGSGDPVATIDFYLPEGTTATSVPDSCETAWTSGDDPTIGHYACSLRMWAKPDLDISFPFQLRIDRVVPDATGHVIVHPHGDKPVVFDPDSANNTAEVVVNPTA
ncbi:hypothetical protein OH768_05190 [Streptomyces sp. NBC_01622]|uniref:hypothetical protein n=1 Tax=Streptomyces sp. NBC_01622 TaxID=2975903 RepID=UPI00386BB150|nr:hypothetical protein OH768_05190 [Streptomyces sp. NBC_01622]